MTKRTLLASIAVALGALGTSGYFLAAPTADNLRVVAITANRYQYTPSEITLKKGERVRFRVTSEDMIHGLFVKDLAIDADIVPGKMTEFTLTPRKEGKFTAICVHYCGPGHGSMHMTIVVE